jgi:hypothetical protein
MGKMAGAGADIFDKLEPEPKFLTSWSRSRAQIDRLGNTAIFRNTLLQTSRKTFNMNYILD